MQGWLDLFLRTCGSYYLDIGTSELIADRKVKIQQFDRIAEFLPRGAKLDDGTVVEGEIARLDPEGEWANIWD